MKKVIVIGIAVLMVMGMATMAMAADNNWTLLLKAGNTTTLTYSQGVTQLGIAAAASTGNYSSLATNGAGIYAVDADPAKMGNKDIRVAGNVEYTWHVTLATGSARDAANPVYVGWSFANSTAAPGTKWTIKAFRGKDLVGTYVDDGVYSASTFKIIGNYNMAAGTTDSWTIVASSVPEPGSIVAMLSGLVGLAGFGIRRRK